MAVLKAVVTPQLGEIAGYGLIFGPGPILGNILYVNNITKTGSEPVSPTSVIPGPVCGVPFCNL